MQEDWDDLDRAMLRSIQEKPGQCIRDVIKPFLKEKSETALRNRLRALMLYDYIKFDIGVKKVQCFPKKKIIGMLDTLGGVH